MANSNLIGRAQRWLGRSHLTTRWAVRLRNQCQAVIWNHLCDGADHTNNGEEWLVSAVAPTVTTFADVGTHRGEWTSMLLSHGGPVRAGLLFEPSAQMAASLCDRFRETPTITVIEAAVSDTAGHASFYEEADPRSTETSSLVPGFSLKGAVETKVRVTTIDDEAAAHGLERIDLLKIDCEGYDLHALRGARELLSQQRIGVIQFEYNTPWAIAGSTLGGAYQLLQSYGYEVYLLKSKGLFTFDYARYGDFFAYANFVAVAPEVLPRLRHGIRGSI